MTHDARIYWSRPEVRGSAHLPPTLRYVALSRFPEDSPDWPDGSWSVEVLFDVPPPEQDHDAVSQGRVRFLMEDGPHERLHPGAHFSLYEGLQKVADVEVLS